ncbi:MAG TPA: hypothetical protein VFF18_11940 [Woeseiaceae bacterium]|nr:hypothetical protein [Woeseiaceae bacterium]
MKSFTLAVVLGLAGFAAAAQAECVYPEQNVDMPNGTTATQEEMIAAQKAVKAYMADMEAYLACLKEEHAAAAAEAGDVDEEVAAKRDAMFTKRHDAAVDQMHLVGARFNEQVRAYKGQGE